MKPRTGGVRRSLVMLSVICVIASLAQPSPAQLERFQPREGELIEAWRLTNNPIVRDWANYHSIQCWSHDGRYICFTHFADDGKEFGTDAAAEVHVYDFMKQKDIRVDNGIHPRWANHHHWLFYLKGSDVLWFNVDTQDQNHIAGGLDTLGNVDYKDRWLYGLQVDSTGRRTKAVRIAIQPDSRPEILQLRLGCEYGWFAANPNHPVIALRDYSFKDYFYSTEDLEIPFNARHYIDSDLEGANQTTPFPVMEGSHFSWSGDGSYFLCGNGQIRGRKWDEPFPNNINFLAAINSGDICQCGRSGRWLCGSSLSGRGSLVLADLRSGDGWKVMKSLSVLCYPGEGGYSTAYDIDAKGSPDATKIVFVSTYDLINGPHTEVLDGSDGVDRIVVRSTESFPSSGRLVIVGGSFEQRFRREVIKYSSKTATTFEGLNRGLYGTPQAQLFKGQSVTSFEARLIPPEHRKGLPLPSKEHREVIQDMDSPLMWQKSSDLYVAVVRLPDRPLLHKASNRIEVVPGENHWETRGYHILQDGRRITEQLLEPGDHFDLPEAGTYAAVAVEWSGLESKASLTLTTDRGTRLRVLNEKPADVTWARDRWSVQGQEVSEAEAIQAAEATREIIHVYDGVIHREAYRRGKIVQRDDLNHDGKSIRRLYYKDGKLKRREYHNRQGEHVSTELFDADGFITKTTQHNVYGKPEGATKTWWYQRGVPLKCVQSTPEGGTVTYQRTSPDTWAVE
jgi:hypothetical protein